LIFLRDKYGKKCAGKHSKLIVTIHVWLFSFAKIISMPRIGK